MRPKKNSAKKRIKRINVTNKPNIFFFFCFLFDCVSRNRHFFVFIKFPFLVTFIQKKNQKMSQMTQKPVRPTHGPCYSCSTANASRCIQSTETWHGHGAKSYQWTFACKPCYILYKEQKREKQRLDDLRRGPCSLCSVENVSHCISSSSEITTGGAQVEKLTFACDSCLISYKETVRQRMARYREERTINSAHAEEKAAEKSSTN